MKEGKKGRRERNEIEWVAYREREKKEKETEVFWLLPGRNKRF